MNLIFLYKVKRVKRNSQLLLCEAPNSISLDMMKWREKEMVQMNVVKVEKTSEKAELLYARYCI